MTVTPQDALAAHFAAVAAGDMNGLLDGYAEDAVVLTSQGPLEGRGGVQTFFTNALAALPGAQFSLKNGAYSADAALVHWSADSPAGRIEDGVDTFVFRDGKIRLHSVHFTVQAT